MTEQQYALGKLPARNTVRFKMRDYIPESFLPPQPAGDFGHSELISDWQVLGNNDWGDCAIAGPYHGEMLFNAVGGRSINVNTACVLDAYSAITNFDINAGPPGKNPTDRGSNVESVAEYWRTVGLTDASGINHKIDAYIALEPGNLDELYMAMYLFDGVGIGVNFPQEWMDAFKIGSSWEALPSYRIVGGHYILGVGRTSGYIDTITWGRQQMLSPAGYRQFNDETLAYVSTERLLASGKDINGFNLDQLLADLQELPSVS
jgi:hypothetical protein